jgi:tetratricopeptide (TPR) repeat protein
MRRMGSLLFTLIVTILASSFLDGALAAKLGYSRAYCLSETISAHEAISACTAVLQKFRKNANVFIRRGVAFGELGEFDYAVGDFSRAIKLDPNSALAFQLRGLAREMQGQLQESLVDYMQGLELRPFDQEVRTAILRVTDAFAVLSLADQLSNAPDEQRVDNVRSAPEKTPPSTRSDRPAAAMATESDASFLLVPSILILASAAVTVWLIRRRENGITA